MLRVLRRDVEGMGRRRWNLWLKKVVSTGEGLYESSRAVSMVDGSPRAPSLTSIGSSKSWVNRSQKCKYHIDFQKEIAPEQFSSLPEVTSYPGMHLLSRFYSLGEIPQGGKIFHDSGIEHIFGKSAFWWALGQFFGPCRGLTHHKGAFAPKIISEDCMCSISAVDIEATDIERCRAEKRKWQD